MTGSVRLTIVGEIHSHNKKPGQTFWSDRAVFLPLCPLSQGVYVASPRLLTSALFTSYSRSRTSLEEVFHYEGQVGNINRAAAVGVPNERR